MPDPFLFLLAVFLMAYLLFVVAMAFIVTMLIGHVLNITWKLMRKVFPSLPENRDEYFEEVIEEGRRARAQFLGVSDRDKH